LGRGLLLGWGLLLRGRGLGDGSLEHGLFVLEAGFEEEVGSELFVLVAGEVCLCGLALRESETYQSVDGLHLLLGHLDAPGRGVPLATCSACSAEAGDVGVSTKDKIHEGAGVLLNNLEELGLRSCQLLHELVVEVRVLEDALSDQCEVRVACEGSERVRARGHAAASDRGVVVALVAVVVSALGVSQVSLAQGHAGCEDLIGDIRDALSRSEGQDALVSRFAR